MSDPKHRPFVPENAKLREFSWGALLLGLTMTVILARPMPIWACTPA